MIDFGGARIAEDSVIMIKNINRMPYDFGGARIAEASLTLVKTVIECLWIDQRG